MAAKTASLSVNIIADAAKAKAGFNDAGKAANSFSDQIKNANGAVNKFKVGSGAALDFVKNNAMNFASAAGAAVVAFGVKSVMAFQDLALSAGKFSDATGLAVEDASRLIEVAGDIGVEVASVEKAVGFMNKTLGKSPELFKNLGVEIKYAANGTTDVNATFLEVVDRLNQIKDPAERAAAAAALLGKGWMDMSELITGGSDSLASSLAEVSDAKIIDEKEVEKARQFRASMDSLNDAFEDISLTLGQTLVPILTEALSGLAGFVEKAKEIGAFDAFGVSIGNVAKFALKLGFGGLTAADALYDLGKNLIGVDNASDDAAASLDKAGIQTEKLDKAWKVTRNTFSDGRFVSKALVDVWTDGYVQLIASGKASKDLTDVWVEGYSELFAAGQSSEKLINSWRSGYGELVESRKVSEDLVDSWQRGYPVLIKGKESSDFLVNAWRDGYEALRNADEATVDLKNSWIEGYSAFRNADRATINLKDAWVEGYRAMIDALPPARNLNSEIESQEQLLEDAMYAWDLFKGNLSLELERQDLVSDIEAFRDKWVKSSDEAKRKSEEYRAELLRLQIQVANFGGEAIRTATIATQNKIKVLVETGQLERAVQLLQYIRNNTLGFVATPKLGTFAVTPYGAIPARAAGGIITKPEVSLVGEAGPEAIIPLSRPGRALELMQESGLDMLAMGGRRGGGNTYISVSVDAGLVSSPDQVGQQIIEAIRRAERRSGQVFVGV